MDKNIALNLATALAPLVQYVALRGDGEHLAKVMEATIENIGDQDPRAPAKSVLIHMASVARSAQSLKPK